MSITALVLAAGSGTRFGADKMEVFINGRRPWEIVEGCLRPLVDSLVVVGKDISGGETRRESVLRGLAHVKTDRVIIAEGARFLPSTSDYDLAIRSEGSAVAFGSPSINSAVLKLTNSFTPIPRNLMSIIHTPQVFDAGLLRQVLDRFGHLSDGDEWSLMATLNQWDCRLIPGSWRTGLKLTYPGDLELMEMAFNAQDSGSRGWLGHRAGASHADQIGPLAGGGEGKSLYERGA